MGRRRGDDARRLLPLGLVPTQAQFLILALCAIGLFASIRMQAKALQAERGRLHEPSIVQTPRARVFGRIPNSAFGIAYYTLLAISSFFFASPLIHDAALVACLLAAVMSAYLAYSLLFVTRMPCVFCWTGHIVNWLLLAIVVATTR